MENKIYNNVKTQKREIAGMVGPKETSVLTNIFRLDDYDMQAWPLA